MSSHSGRGWISAGMGVKIKKFPEVFAVFKEGSSEQGLVQEPPRDPRQFGIIKRFSPHSQKSEITELDGISLD